MKLTESQVLLLKNLAVKLQVNYEWLYNLLNFESRFNPLAINKFTGAIGLIQFIPSTLLSEFNLTSKDIIEKYNTFESQIPLVEKYLSKYKPFPTKQSLYMAVFYPKYRNVAPDTLFPQKVQEVNKPIKKVQDYVDLVEGKFLKVASKVVPVLTILILSYILYKKF